MANAVTDRVGQCLLEVWQQHNYSEWVMKDAKAALTTMSDNPHVLMVPIAVGGGGRDGVYNFYHNYFLAQLPADIRPVPISQVVGSDMLVEEAVFQFTHDQVMDWMIPGVPPTGKRVEVGVTAIVRFEGGKIASEHLYWDHASVLAQVGVLDPARVPVKGVESAHTLLEWAGITPGASTSHEPQSKEENTMRKSYWLGGTRLSVLRSAAETAGRYDLVEGWFPTGAQVPPHRHGRYSEQIYVLAGEFTVWAGDRKSVLRPGDDLTIPTGTAHALAVTGGPGQALVVTSPSGFARLVSAVGTPDEGGEAPPSAPPDMDLLARVSAELGDEILGPPGALPDEFAEARGER
jgi:quercetin dioxygenase-like cupin family protein